MTFKFIYKGQDYYHDPNLPVVDTTQPVNPDGVPVFGTQTLKEVLEMTDAEATAAYKEGAWNSHRPERDRLLQKCDWVVSKYTELGQPIPDEWKTYRQALRDITSQSDPDNIVWPTKPS